MIKQSNIGLNSRSEADPFNDGMLPLITAPMNTVVNKDNYKVFLDNKINVCLPRGVTGLDINNLKEAQYADKYNKNVWFSQSLNNFINWYITDNRNVKVKHYTCIDTANGNMPKLHKAIRKAKELHGNNLVIMAGNVSSVEAFVELANAGADYIRVGIGGGGACTTTTHTGVGQDDLKGLISKCNSIRISYGYNPSNFRRYRLNLAYDLFYGTSGYSNNRIFSDEEKKNIAKVKIVADGISSYIKKENLHENGYAAINQLLHVGADLVMIGSIFNKALESAGDKRFNVDDGYMNLSQVHEDDRESEKLAYFKEDKLEVLYRGMSTKEEQKTYKSTGLRHSEGKSQYNKVMYTLDEWINGSSRKPDEYPGFIDCLKSAMSYTGSKSLSEFKS